MSFNNDEKHNNPFLADPTRQLSLRNAVRHLQTRRQSLLMHLLPARQSLHLHLQLPRASGSISPIHRHSSSPHCLASLHDHDGARSVSGYLREHSTHIFADLALWFLTWRAGPSRHEPSHCQKQQFPRYLRKSVHYRDDHTGYLLDAVDPFL